MLSVLLAAVTAVCMGVADYLGGRASRRISSWATNWWAYGVTIALEGAGVLVMADGAPTRTELIWGLAAGAASLCGLPLFFRCLALGSMTVIAPITAVTAASVPVLVGLLQGESPGTLPLFGVACAIGAITLVNSGSRDLHTPPATVTDRAVSRRARARWARVSPIMVGMALLCGTCFAMFFVFLDYAREDRYSLWPALLSQVVGFAGASAVTWYRRARFNPWSDRPGIGWALASGVIGSAGTVAYTVAVGYGDLAIVGPISCLYPVSTVVLALAVDRERLRGGQIAGLVLAGASLVLAGSA